MSEPDKLVQEVDIFLEAIDQAQEIGRNCRRYATDDKVDKKLLLYLSDAQRYLSDAYASARFFRDEVDSPGRLT